MTLIRAYQAGDNAAGAELLRRHDKFLQLLVFQRHGRGMKLNSEGDDLMQLARIGLLRAAREFDFREISFLTPVFWWVRGELQHYRRDNSSKVFGLPDRVIRILSKVAKEQKLDSLSAALEEAFRQGLVTKETYVKVGLSVSGLSSLDVPAHSDGKDSPGGYTALKDTIVSEDPNAEDQLGKVKLCVEVQAVLQEMGLSARERAIVRHRLTAHEEDELTLKEIGQMFDLSRERIRQIEARVVEKLRKHLAHLA